MHTKLAIKPFRFFLLHAAIQAADAAGERPL
jgi:hypothetical protein